MAQVHELGKKLITAFQRRPAISLNTDRNAQNAIRTLFNQARLKGQVSTAAKPFKYEAHNSGSKQKQRTLKG